MNKKQLYLDPNLSLDSLAESLEINRNYLSKVIDHLHSVHYSIYVINFRIRRAIHLISSRHDAEVYNFEGIAKEVGFANRTTFLSAFKKYTGVTPSFS
ncbi:MAG: helix-turn-helix domain-containing protein [Ignavibacteria bacterium]|nr:helix-turn-helix domain-containing protein [Ignavibacteria bacterium]